MKRQNERENEASLAVLPDLLMVLDSMEECRHSPTLKAYVSTSFLTPTTSSKANLQLRPSSHPHRRNRVFIKRCLETIVDWPKVYDDVAFKDGRAPSLNAEKDRH
ncbi:hypothetical protein JHK85_025227 [Glycine max]|nr:hypothetical protein JHK85_025227 [Glycine max]KAG5012465.1 hypothetical protein JHK86_024726 [Glycine max]